MGPTDRRGWESGRTSSTRKPLAPGQRSDTQFKVDSAVGPKQTMDTTKQVRLTIDSIVGHFWSPEDLKRYLKIEIEDRSVLQSLQDDEGLHWGGWRRPEQDTLPLPGTVNRVTKSYSTGADARQRMNNSEDYIFENETAAAWQEAVDSAQVNVAGASGSDGNPNMLEVAPNKKSDASMDGGFCVAAGISQSPGAAQPDNTRKRKRLTGICRGRCRLPADEVEEEEDQPWRHGRCARSGGSVIKRWCSGGR